MLLSFSVFVIKVVEEIQLRLFLQSSIEKMWMVSVLNALLHRHCGFGQMESLCTDHWLFVMIIYIIHIQRTEKYSIAMLFFIATVGLGDKSRLGATCVVCFFWWRASAVATVKRIEKIKQKGRFCISPPLYNVFVWILTLGQEIYKLSCNLQIWNKMKIKHLWQITRL